MQADLVSVITPTWQREYLLGNCVEQVQKQTYPHIEHIIVSDGPFETIDLDASIQDQKYFHPWMGIGRFPVRLEELAYNTSSYLYNSFGIAPLLVGMLLAEGEYQMWLSDDDMMDPTHIEKLVVALKTEQADFAYSQCVFYWNGQSIEKGEIIGTNPPKLGQITNFLYRRELLSRPNCMPMFGSHPVDWSLVEAWMHAGARWAFVQEPTFYHRADQ